jgi:hypothetical protein
MVSLIKKSLVIASFSFLQPILGYSQPLPHFTQDINQESKNIKKLRSSLKESIQQELAVLKNHYYMNDPVRRKVYQDDLYKMVTEQWSLCKILAPQTTKICNKALELLRVQEKYRENNFYQRFDNHLILITSEILHPYNPQLAQALQELIIFKNTYQVNSGKPLFVESLEFIGGYKKISRNILNIINKIEWEGVVTTQEAKTK